MTPISKAGRPSYRKLKYYFFTLFVVSCLKISSQTQIPGPSVKGTTKVSKYQWTKDWLKLPEGYIMGNPTGIGIDTKQNIFVFIRAGRIWTDPMPDSLISEKTILMLDRETGKIINSWGARLFIMPHGLTVDKKDNVWVTDVGLHQVFKFDHEGRLLMKLGAAKVSGNDSAHFNQPTDIAVADDGSFFVSDGYGNNRIVKFSASGKYLFEWGSKGNGPGEFDLPHALAMDEKGNVYVADRENSRIQKFDVNGKFMKKWTKESFAKMYSLTIDRRKNVLIGVDYLKEESTIKGSDIILFDMEQDQAEQFGRSGSYTGPVGRYHDVAIDRAGNLYICDILGNSIQKFKNQKP